MAADAARLLLRALERLHPGLAARAVVALFFRAPPRRARPPAEREVLRGASRRDLVVRGLRVPVWSWGEGPPVLLVHGWGGRGAQLHALVAPLRAAGYRPVAFDGPGHGDASGARSNVALHAEVAAEVARSLPPLRAVVAHSFGAPAVAFAQRRGLGAARMVMIGPAASPGAYLLRFLDAAGLGERARARVVALASEELGAGMAELDVAPPEVPPPLLVVHDRGDREVPFADGARIAARWPGARLVATERLGHRRVLEDPAVVARVVSFVDAERRGGEEEHEHGDPGAARAA